jgi:hypothetical protein
MTASASFKRFIVKEKKKLGARLGFGQKWFCISYAFRALNTFRYKADKITRKDEMYSMEILYCKEKTWAEMIYTTRRSYIHH